MYYGLRKYLKEHVNLDVTPNDAWPHLLGHVGMLEEAGLLNLFFKFGIWRNYCQGSAGQIKRFNVLHVAPRPQFSHLCFFVM